MNQQVFILAVILGVLVGGVERASASAEPKSFKEAHALYLSASRTLAEFQSSYEGMYFQEIGPYRKRISGLEESCKKCGDYDCSKKFQDEIFKLKAVVRMEMCREGLPSSSLCQMHAELKQRQYQLQVIGGSLTYEVFLFEIINFIRTHKRVSNFIAHPIKACSYSYQEGGYYDEQLNVPCNELVVDYKYNGKFRRLKIHSAPYGVMGFPSSPDKFMKDVLKKVRLLVTKLEGATLGLRRYIRNFDEDRERRGASPVIIMEGFSGIIYSMVGFEVNCDECDR